MILSWWKIYLLLNTCWINIHLETAFLGREQLRTCCYCLILSTYSRWKCLSSRKLQIMLWIQVEVGSMTFSYQSSKFLQTLLLSAVNQLNRSPLNQTARGLVWNVITEHKQQVWKVILNLWLVCTQVSGSPLYPSLSVALEDDNLDLQNRCSQSRERMPR